MQKNESFKSNDFEIEDLINKNLGPEASLSQMLKLAAGSPLNEYLASAASDGKMSKPNFRINAQPFYPNGFS